MGLSERLKNARKEKRLTQKEAAEKLGISIGTLSGYERNYREPDLDMIKKLATLYGVSSSWLIGEEELKKEKDDEEFRAFINDPELESWYRELPENDEEDLKQLKEMWEVIKKHKK